MNVVAGETDPTDTHVFDDVEEEEEEEESNPEVVVPTPAPSTEAPPHQPDVVVPPQQPESPVVETPVDGTVPKHNVPDETPHTTDRGTHPVDASGGVAKAGDRQASFFAQPGILAGEFLPLEIFSILIYIFFFSSLFLSSQHKYRFIFPSHIVIMMNVFRNQAFAN